MARRRSFREPKLPAKQLAILGTFHLLFCKTCLNSVSQGRGGGSFRSLVSFMSAQLLMLFLFFFLLMMTTSTVFRGFSLDGPQMLSNHKSHLEDDFKRSAILGLLFQCYMEFRTFI